MWRFIQLSDLHLDSRVDGLWNNRVICTMMPEVMSCLRRDLAELRPDFILVTGDIASRASRDAVFAARDLLDSLGFPYYPMGGNHDFETMQCRKWFVEAYQAHLPERNMLYSFTHKSLHFCVLDPWWRWPDGTVCPFIEGSQDGAAWVIPPDQYNWLEADLAAHPRRPTVIAVHYPAVGIPKRMWRPGIKNAGSLTDGELLMGLLRKHPQVKAVLSGHLHMNFITFADGVAHVVTGALPEYPVEYRDVHVYGDRIEIHTRGLSDSSFAARSAIPGHEWAAGAHQDRTAVIYLK